MFTVLYVLLIGGEGISKEYVEVLVEGVEGELYDNVLNSLTIHKKRNSEKLNDRIVGLYHRKAEKEIRLALEPFGYYDVIISNEIGKINEHWQVQYTISLSEPVKINSLSLQFTENENQMNEVVDIKQLFPLTIGDVLDHSLYKQGKKKLLERLYSKGYIRASFKKSVIEIRKKENRADIKIVIDPGKLYLFGKVLFEQEMLEESFLSRFINFQYGEPYSLSKLLHLQQILYRTNYFGKVEVVGEVDKAEALYIPITVKLSEPDFFNTYGVGLGYATDDGIRMRLGWKNRLMNRSGHSVSLELKVAETDSSLKFLYGVPANNPRFDKFLMGATYVEEEWADTDTRLFSTGVAYEYAGNRFKYGGGMEIRDEKFSVGEVAGESFLAVPSLSWSMVYGDDLVNTKNGFSLSVNGKGAVENVFADTSFFQTVLSGKWIVTPFDGLRFLGKFSLGGTQVDSVEDMPPSLRFYTGGDQTVRGYSYKELGSKNSDGTVIGGKYLIFGSIEAEKTVYGNWSGAVFFDTGKGINSLAEDLAEGVGIGVRYRLPFGQIRLDMASALSEEDNPIRIHLTIGGDL